VSNEDLYAVNFAAELLCLRDQSYIFTNDVVLNKDDLNDLAVVLCASSFFSFFFFFFLHLVLFLHLVKVCIVVLIVFSVCTFCTNEDNSLIIMSLGRGECSECANVNVERRTSTIC